MAGRDGNWKMENRKWRLWQWIEIDLADGFGRKAVPTCEKWMGRRRKLGAGDGPGCV